MTDDCGAPNGPYRCTLPENHVGLHEAKEAPDDTTPLCRYRASDDFGHPSCSFTLCTLWMAKALWLVGERAEGEATLRRVLDRANPHGLLSEDIHLQTGELWGNFPQTYSMAGLVLTAMRLSRSWEDRYWRG